jgi:arylsulfatase A-like enzyme/predicted Zn-dependent protease
VKRTPWLLGLALTACGGSTPAPTTPAPEATPEAAQRTLLKVSEEHPNVVLITLDTFRADRLGVNGYDKAQTDTLDVLARNGLQFKRAYSPLPLTIPSHSTMFTGRYPPTLGIRSNGHGMLTEEDRILPEILHDAGYTTAASVAAYVTTRGWGFNQGFDAYFDDIPAAKDENFWHGERPANEVIDDALGWKDEQDPTNAQFVWIHLYDAHFPYAPSEEYLERAEGRPYDGEIAFVDDQVARVVRAYEGTPTLFVFAGDHGEGLGDHRELTHGMFAYSATQHVPLFFSGTGVEPAVVEDPVSLVDLMPTLLTLLDLEVPDDVEGRVANASEPAPVYMETYQLSERFKLAPHVAVVDGKWKFVDLPKPELYDLLVDAGEKNNLADAHPEEVTRLRGVLQAFDYKPPGDKEVLDPDVAAELAVLGYTEGGEMPDFDQELPDFKDHLDLIMLSQRAERLQMQSTPKEALGVLEELNERYPDLIEFRTRRASLLRKMGRIEESRKAIVEAVERDPTNPNLRTMLAGIYAEEGRFEEAARLFTEVANEVPYLPRVRAMAVLARRQTGDHVGAIELGNGWMKAYPDDASLFGALGVVYIEAGQYDLGMPLLDKGITADKAERDVAFYLAAGAIGSGEMDEGRRLLELEVENHPTNLRAATALLRVYIRSQAWMEQVELSDTIIQLQEKDLNAHHAKVLGLFNLEKYEEARKAVDAGLAIDDSYPDLVLMDANLLAKEGKLEEGKARFEVAKKVREERADAVREAVEARKLPPIPGFDAEPAAPEPSENNPFGLPEVGLDELFEGGAPKQRPPK